MKLLVLCFGIFCSISAFAQPTLIKDFYEGENDGIPDWKEGNAKIGNTMIFAANDGVIGAELYKLEDERTFLIKDLLAGPESSDPSGFITYNDLVYFSAKNENGKYNIYSTDGTAANTKLAISIDADEHVYEFFNSSNGKLYFHVGFSIYVTTGTTETTQEIETDYHINFDNSWIYASTNIVNYKNGVAFSGYSDKKYCIFYHNGIKLDTLTSFDATSNSKILGPINTAGGIVYGVQDPFNNNVVGLFHINSTTKEVNEILIGEQAVKPQRLMEVNGQYGIFKPFNGGIYSYNGTTLVKLTDGGDNFSLYQGEEIPHAVIGNKVFFLGLVDWFDKQYYISDGTSAGTVPIVTPGASHPGRNLITDGSTAYMFQGTSNGAKASLIEIDFITQKSRTIYQSTISSTTQSKFEVMNILDDKVYFAAQLSSDIGRELYLANSGEKKDEFLFPTSGNEVVTSCDTTIYDDGGSMGNYSANVDASVTLIPTDSYKAIKVKFYHFDIEDKWDQFVVTENNREHKFTGSILPDPISSSAEDGQMTLSFKSDTFGHLSGFEIKVSCVVITSINENKRKIAKIYPNPSTGIVNSKWPSTNDHSITVSDLSGKVVYKTNLKGMNNQIDLSSLAKGFYELTITDGNTTSTEKLIITN